MKVRRIIAASAVVVAVCLALAGCVLPGSTPTDPIIPVIPVVPALDPITATFDYTCFVDPIQTDSWVYFDGGDSYSPDGGIVYGEWDFDDGVVLEGNWLSAGFWEWVNGERQWVAFVGMMEVAHVFIDTGWYNVKLTVWDSEGNYDSMSCHVQVR